MNTKFTPRWLLIGQLRQALNLLETPNSSPYFDIEGYAFAYEADWLDSPDLRVDRYTIAPTPYGFKEGDIVEGTNESFPGSEVVRTIVLVNGRPYARFMAGGGCNVDKLRKVSK